MGQCRWEEKIVISQLLYISQNGDILSVVAELIIKFLKEGPMFSVVSLSLYKSYKLEESRFFAKLTLPPGGQSVEICLRHSHRLLQKKKTIE